jgi:hypothetical protein
MPKPTNHARGRRSKNLLSDQLSRTLEERCTAYLRKGLPPGADEFDRACYQAMANFLRIGAQIHKSSGAGEGSPGPIAGSGTRSTSAKPSE